MSELSLEAKLASVRVHELDAAGRGWEWEPSATAEGGDFVKVTRNYHTNADGEGLWNGDRQIQGTCQFSLPANRDTARRKIRAYFGA